jgi:hypothetical protein
MRSSRSPRKHTKGHAFTGQALDEMDDSMWQLLRRNLMGITGRREPPRSTASAPRRSAEARRPLGVAAAGGLVFSQLISLYVYAGWSIRTWTR